MSRWGGISILSPGGFAVPNLCKTKPMSGFSELKMRVEWKNKAKRSQFRWAANALCGDSG